MTFLAKIMLIFQVNQTAFLKNCSKTLMNVSAFGIKPKKNAVPLLSEKVKLLLVGVG